MPNSKLFVLILLLLIPVAFGLGLWVGQKNLSSQGPASALPSASPTPPIDQAPPEFTNQAEAAPASFTFLPLKVISLSQAQLTGQILTQAIPFLPSLQDTPFENKTQLTAKLEPQVQVTKTTLNSDPAFKKQLEQFNQLLEQGQPLPPDQLPPPSPITSQTPAQLSEVKVGDTVVAGVSQDPQNPTQFFIQSLDIIQNPEVLF